VTEEALPVSIFTLITLVCFDPLFEGLDPEAYGFGNELGDTAVGSKLLYQLSYAGNELVVDGNASVISVRHEILHLSFIDVVYMWFSLLTVAASSKSKTIRETPKIY
jgi:hypothetical protein